MSICGGANARDLLPLLCFAHLRVVRDITIGVNSPACPPSVGLVGARQWTEDGLALQGGVGPKRLQEPGRKEGMIQAGFSPRI